jgi:hypothetical protein
MKQTFYEIDTAFLSDELSSIKQYAINTSGYSVYGYEGIQTSIAAVLKNSLSPAEPRPQFFKILDSSLSLPLIKKLGISPSLAPNNTAQVGGTLMLNKPYFKILPHIDWASDKHRKSCLTFPLYPDPPHFAPTIFYDSSHNEIYRYNYKHNTAVILDTRIMHGMINNAYKRISLQLTYNLEPQELYKALVCR